MSDSDVFESMTFGAKYRSVWQLCNKVKTCKHVFDFVFFCVENCASQLSHRLRDDVNCTTDYKVLDWLLIFYIYFQC